MKELKLRQSIFDINTSKNFYGPKTIELAEDMSYVRYDKQKLPLTFVQEIRFGNPLTHFNVASRDISRQFIYRAEFDDFVIVEFYNKKTNTFEFDHIDFFNIEFRL